MYTEVVILLPMKPLGILNNQSQPHFFTGSIFATRETVEQSQTTNQSPTHTRVAILLPVKPLNNPPPQKQSQPHTYAGSNFATREAIKQSPTTKTITAPHIHG